MFCMTSSCPLRCQHLESCHLRLQPNFAIICSFDLSLLQVARHGAPALQKVAASRSRSTVAGPKTPNISSKRKTVGRPAHKVYPTGWRDSDTRTSHEVILVPTAKHMTQDQDLVWRSERSADSRALALSLLSVSSRAWPISREGMNTWNL